MRGEPEIEARERRRIGGFPWFFVLVSLAFGRAFLGCEPHELVFPAASAGSGGESVEGTGGGPPGSGGFVEGPGEGGGPFAPPCIATERCDWPCEDGECASCERSEECFFELPHCDVALGACVECLVAEHCSLRYGGLFPACSAGRCVQCQRDEDCGAGIRCRSGWCGSCDSDRECADGFECVRDHCLPRQ